MIQEDQRTTYLASVRVQIERSFSLSELRSICFDLGLDYENFIGQDSTKSDFIIQLLSHLDRSGRINDLIARCRATRPNLSWVEYNPSTNQANTIARTPSPSNRLSIFLCHSSKDKEKVRELYRKLQNDGFNPWLDEEDNLPGQNWKQEILKAAKNADIVLVCLSSTSISRRGYVQKEIKYALDIAENHPEGTIFIIPVRLEECKMPARLADWQWVDLFQPAGYGRLRKSLRLQAKLKSSNSDISISGKEAESIEMRTIGNVIVITAPDSLDSVNALIFKERLFSILDEGQHRIVIDCANLDYISSPGMVIFIQARKVTHDWRYSTLEHGDVRIANLLPKMKELFEFTGFSSIFRIFSSVDDAVKSF